jgi:hypothetical protein
MVGWNCYGEAATSIAWLDHAGKDQDKALALRFLRFEASS